ncbi:MAG: hypothetical protein A2756_05000 [Candidatus Ryanbacteria bacterium RIFCSPHIGHO2_01_FULL_48_27]|uniref:Type I restriction enzyme R protein N-terminal domain-containing protein n=1 Tax=Candidatus Ryanbacteria bacterium RIFCSPHIGHO2_01_FULL_48_27 TaxID=1802115 RepID=A0A1G2G4L0_9BACT|nr:MAG: hypothetical protein A2756_05000 [Candidatus Ryanbacteria bacterium RIFCSPHIGHO2_01_FULL_48_27]
MTEANRPRQLKADTRQWNSGRVKFAVIGWQNKPEKNYIILEKNFFGHSRFPDQKFNLLQKDWKNLKTLIDGELQPTTNWDNSVVVASSASIEKVLKDDPDVIEKILANPNILKLSDRSLESLDRIAIKLYEVKTEQMDLILKELSNTSADDIQKFGILLNDLRLNQVSMMTSLVYQKLKIIDLLETVITQVDKKEKDVHQIFEKHPWLLGRTFEIVTSDKPLSEYLQTNIKDDPETKKRPDIIAKVVPYINDVVLIELKAPGIKLKANHIGQVLTYKALIERHKPNVKNIHCFVFGYEKDTSFTLSRDATIKTFSELAAELRDEYREYQKILDMGKEYQEEDLPL